LVWITTKDAALRQFTRLFFCLTLACASIAVAQAEYTLPFPNSAAWTGAQALSSLPKRIPPVMECLTCGSEFDFLKSAQPKSDGKDPLSIILAKMAWAKGLQGGVASAAAPQDFPSRPAYDGPTP
jgi:hypothetical protein